MSSLISGAVDQLCTSVGYIAGGQITKVARGLIYAVLNRIQIGQLVIDEDGQQTACGSMNLAIGSPPLPVTILRVKNKAFWTRVAIFADMVSCCI